MLKQTLIEVTFLIHQIAFFNQIFRIYLDSLYKKKNLRILLTLFYFKYGLFFLKHKSNFIKIIYRKELLFTKIFSIKKIFK